MVKEKIALGIFIFSVLALLILLFFAFQGKMTGKVIGEDNQRVNEMQKTCSDSDGVNYNIKGYVNYCVDGKCSVTEDSCSGKKLTESYCGNNELKYEEHECEFDCDEGVCLNKVIKYTQPNIGGGSGGSSGGGGGGSPGSSSLPVVDTSITYELGELSSEKTLEVLKNDKIKFTLGGSEYTLTLQDNTESKISLSSVGDVYVGEEKNADLNNDNISDLYVKVRSINNINKKITLTLNRVF